MTSIDFDILSIERGSIVAPAGCGKTQLITDSLKRHSGKPVLILTHTNAGVAALRARLTKANVRPNLYRLSTIDGWSMKMVSTFPRRASFDLEILDRPRIEYPAVRQSALTLLRSENISPIIRSTYHHLLVDEYQDCTIEQHEIVCEIAKTLNTCVLGDRLQAIFGFGSNRLPDWESQVSEEFPNVGTLATPWRWNNAGSQGLGEWLLAIRNNLIENQPIDLREAPSEVTWIQLDGNAADFKKIVVAAGTKTSRPEDSVLIIGDSRSAESRHRVASSVHGAVTVETVDYQDLVTFARSLDLASTDALAAILNFAQTLMSNVGAPDLLKRVETIKAGRAKKKPNAVEIVALRFLDEPTYKSMGTLLEEINKDTGVRAFRPTLLRACHKALLACQSDSELTFLDAVIRIREQNRILGRQTPKRAVGSTLLLKGLEAEVAVVLNADDLDANNLYVAMTRGSKKLVVCSKSPIVNA